MIPDHLAAPAASAFRRCIKARGLTMAGAAVVLGKSKPQVVNWCNGVTPSLANRILIEAFCAERDDAGEPIPHPTLPGHWRSSCPRDLWLSGAAAPSPEAA